MAGRAVGHCRPFAGAPPSRGARCHVIPADTIVAMSGEPAGARTMHAIIDAARANLADDIWDYVAGAAETETTARRNRLAFDSLALAPRVLRDVSNVDPSSTLLGHPLRIPVVLAPLGALELITPDGRDRAQVRAAERFGADRERRARSRSRASRRSRRPPPGRRSASSTSAATPPGSTSSWIASLAAGYAAIALTVDTAHLRPPRAPGAPRLASARAPRRDRRAASGRRG